MNALDLALARCPTPEEIGKGTCFGVPLADMSRDQLLQLLWLFSRQVSTATVPA